MKEPVKIRQRKLKNGNISLYLDIYYDGERVYEFLKLYLVQEKTKDDKLRNRQTLKLATAIKSKRVLDIHNNTYGFHRAKETQLIPYYRSISDKKKSHTWTSSYKHISRYAKPNIKIKDLTPRWIEGYKEYLFSRSLHSNTVKFYVAQLSFVLRQAIKEEIIQRNPFLLVEPIKPVDAERPYLTISEVKLLANTDYSDCPTKVAFLFSCLTGIRKIDLLRMRWADVQQQDDFTRIIFRQKKTSSFEYLDISPQATTLLPPKGTQSLDSRVFADFVYNPHVSNKLRKWANSVGIDKPITFHSGRHTFAVMMLSLDTDIYTLSKLLGHKSLTATQVYAKVLDKKKQDAITKIPSFFKPS